MMSAFWRLIALEFLRVFSPGFFLITTDDRMADWGGSRLERNDRACTYRHIIIFSAFFMNVKPRVQVLIVEDDEEDLSLAKRALASGGKSEYLLMPFQRLKDAVEYLGGEHSIDVVLLDLGLPDGAGLENVKSIRAQSADIPIVVLTGWDEVFARKLISAGAQQYISKIEIGNNGLVEAIERALEPGEK